MTTEVTNPRIATISSLAAHEGETITLRGWLYNIRSSGKLLFPTFRDGTGTIQGIVPKAAVTPEVFDRVKSLTQESSVIVTGQVRADSRAPSGFELDVSDLEIVHLVPEPTPFPIPPKEHGVDFLMEHRHLWVRSPRQSAILRIRAEIMRAAAEYFDTNGFIRTDPPILTPAACEGTSTLFELDYFGDPAFLTQSGQLYMEATALALGKVYSFGPTFRAGKSKTRRHLTEFWMIEPEVAFMDLDGDMQLAEAFITHIVTRVLELHRADLKVIGRDVAKLEAIQAPFPRLSYDEAHAMLDEAFKAGKLEAPHVYGDDFGSPDETYISSQFDRPVMIHRYPAAIKAFYMQPDPADPPPRLRRRLRPPRRALHLQPVRSPRHDPPLPRRHQGLLHAARPRRPHQGALRRRPRPRGLRRNHRRLPARRLLRPPQVPHPGADPPASRLQGVPPLPPLWP